MGGSMKPCKRCPEWAATYDALEKQYERLKREHDEMEKDRNVLSNELANARAKARGTLVEGTMTDW